jgi:membrane fusion protein (multidrug efflux system)
VRVRAILPNEDGVLRPGMLMTVDVRSNPREALAIPEIAILDQADGAYVYRVANGDRGQRTELIRIQTGQRAGGMAEVLTRIQAGGRKASTRAIASAAPRAVSRVTRLRRVALASSVEWRSASDRLDASNSAMSLLRSDALDGRGGGAPAIIIPDESRSNISGSNHR